MYLFVLRYAALAASVWLQEIGMNKVAGVLFSLAILTVVGCGDDDVAPQPPSVTTDPADIAVDEGQTAMFIVVATGEGTLTYQWQKNGVDVTGGTGATTDTYTTPATVMADDGAVFHCIVSNAGGNTPSNTATLTVDMLPPVIDTDPASITAVEGQTATFTVVATGSGPPTYQWQKDGVDVTGGTGATSDTYTTPATVLADNAAQFACVVTNGGGSVTSAAATLTVRISQAWRVDHNVTTANDGLTWGTAFETLQDALDVPLSGDEIWVAMGTYYPSEQSTSGAARTETFQLPDGVAVYGGFDGSETSRGQRDWAVNVTTLSGDLNGDDVGFTNNDENAYHVVTGADNATLDGFTVTAGNADGSSHSDGGGMYNDYSSSLTVTRCIFFANSASSNGGGMYNYYSSSTLTNCTFSGNSGYRGGGMYNTGHSSTLTNCTFSGNSANDNGGGMHNYSSSPTLTNCTFSGNSATYGGGMYNWFHASPTATNCILYGNTATAGLGVYTTNQSTPTFSYCDIEDSGGSASWNTAIGADGGSNIADDPLFMDPDGADNIVGTVDDDLRLTAGSSPCIDAGDTTALPADTADLDGDSDTTEDIPHDLDGNSRVVGSEVDMGAYEVQ
jgi:parallel beta-helix repeat protein